MSNPDTLAGFLELLEDGAPTYAALVQEPDGSLRAFPGVADGEARHPYSTWQRISTPTHRHMTAPTGLGELHLQVTHWGELPEDADALARALLGDLDHATFSGTAWQLRRVFVTEAGRDGMEADQAGSGGTFYSVLQELTVWYVRA